MPESGWPIDPRRVRLLQPGDPGPGPVVYWMSRDQRVRDNWALLFAQELARDRRAALVVVFCLVRDYCGAPLRHYDFLLRGLAVIQAELTELGMGFCLLAGEPAAELARLAASLGPAALVADFDPMRPKLAWKRAVAKAITAPFYEVDAHNVAPAWVVSDKQEYAARTIRPKLGRLAFEFLTPFPGPRKLEAAPPAGLPALEADAAKAWLRADSSVGVVDWIEPGEVAARAALERFARDRLRGYAQGRNDPNVGAESDLSPYLHFGQLSAQRAALRVMEEGMPGDADVEAFLEQLIVRRELAENFCLHNPDYDRLEGAPDWGRATLQAHARDPRPELYSLAELEAGRTSSPLWNAAQLEMVSRGKMHNYLRMFWAKKLLEWTSEPAEAVRVAVALNDRFELDGRDPNGYVGVLWSIGGLHDRPWKERPIYGKVRYMNERGAARKFDVWAYVSRWTGGEIASPAPRSGW